MKDSAHAFLEHETVFAETDVTTFQAELDSICFTSPSAAALASKSRGSRAATSSPFLLLLGVGSPILLKQSLICVAVSFCNPSSVAFSSPRVTFPTTSLKADFSRWPFPLSFQQIFLRPVAWPSLLPLLFPQLLGSASSLLPKHRARIVCLGCQVMPSKPRVDAFLLGQLLLF